LAERANETESTTERIASAGGHGAAPVELGIHWVVSGEYTALEFLRGARLRIGRGEDCHLRLEHASVSRHHAEIQRQGPIYVLHDAGSTNGTWLNGERAEHNALSAGDVLRFGECLGIVAKVDRDTPLLRFESLAPDLWGGPTLASALATAKAAARTDLPIVLVGETGAGKERVARALHHWSGRPGRFNAINCATVPAALAEAELFGHQRGAFTGADRVRAGHFQAAHEGTLFLDEISDLSLEVQVKLLRVVEAGEVVPLGGTVATPVNVRIVAAAHEPIARLVEQKRFRPDLYARLAGFEVKLPPLRERREEIPGLFWRLLEKHGSGPTPCVAPTLLEWLCLRPWPGNVRELELMARKLLAVCGADPVLRLDAALKVSAGAADPAPPAPSARSAALGFRNRRESELHRLRLALAATNGNMKAAAERAGISRRRAYRLLDDAKANELEPAGETEEGEVE
jgi:transcriptional regulator of acetoin/glycerol metabolism